MANQYRFIGRISPRKDAREIVTGSITYLNDITVPGMIYGKVLRSPYPHAFVKKVDKSKALALPGVKVERFVMPLPAITATTPYSVQQPSTNIPVLLTALQERTYPDIWRISKRGTWMRLANENCRITKIKRGDEAGVLHYSNERMQ